jgi:hypothetical protein
MDYPRMIGTRQVSRSHFGVVASAEVVEITFHTAPIVDHVTRKGRVLNESESG